VVIEDINPEGKIMVGSEIWTAESGGERFRRGQKVVISGFEGLTAIVRGPLEARIMARTPKTLG
jgi:membrane protein implicated in regulation of membrane protease activity